MYWRKKMKFLSIASALIIAFFSQATMSIKASEYIENDKTHSLRPALGDNGKWGYKDNRDIFVILPRFEYAGEFHNGIAVVGLLKKKFYYINLKGTILFNALFDDVINFIEKFSAVIIDMGEIKKWAYIDKNKILCIFSKFDSVNNFKVGKAFVPLGEKHIYIDKQSRIMNKH